MTFSGEVLAVLTGTTIDGGIREQPVLAGGTKVGINSITRNGVTNSTSRIGVRVRTGGKTSRSQIGIDMIKVILSRYKYYYGILLRLY